METKAKILGRFKGWASAFQQRFFAKHGTLQSERQKDFRDSHQRMTDLHDQEMERLVKVIESTRDENSMRYH